MNGNDTKSQKIFKKFFQKIVDKGVTLSYN